MNNMILECGVYQIVSPNNSFYIGMTSISFDERWKNHIKKLRYGANIQLRNYSSNNRIIE